MSSIDHARLNRVSVHSFVFSLTFLLFLLPISALAAPPPIKTIAHDEWELIAFPVINQSTTFESVLSDDIPIEGYGTDWILLTFDQSTGEYKVPDLTQFIEVGTSYWFKQLVADVVELDVPEQSAIFGSRNGACSPHKECASKNLQSSPDQFDWFMLGTPFGELRSLSSLRIESGDTADEPCFHGCSLDYAFEENVVFNKMYAYDSEIQAYVELTSSSDITPWTGFWFLTLDTSQSSTLYLALDDSVTALPQVPLFGIVQELTTVDLNDDNLKDILLSRTREVPWYSGSYIQVLINNGNRTFTDETATRIPNYDTAKSAIEKLYVTDMNSDSRPDIVSYSGASFGNAVLQPLLLSEDGVLNEMSSTTITNNSGGYFPIDVDADGDKDLLMSLVENWSNLETQHNSYRWLENTGLNNGSPIFTDRGIVNSSNQVGRFNSGAFIRYPLVDDFDNDGDEDFLTHGTIWNNGFSFEKGVISLYINSGNNEFTEQSQTLITGTVDYNQSRFIEKADLDMDGDNDIVLANSGFDGLPFPGEGNAILRNMGSGFIEDLGTENTLNYDGYSHGMALGDVNGDGYTDIVYADLVGDDILYAQYVRVILNNGDGSFSNTQFVDTTENGWISLNLTDLDNDGHEDLILGAINGTRDSAVFWGTGDPSFR